MAKVPIVAKKWATNTDIYNGDNADISKLDTSANSVFARKICIASQAWETGNAPALFAKSWAAATAPERDTTCKIRADIPTILQGATYYGSAIAKTKITANVVIYNADVSAGICDNLYLYSGDNANADKQAYALFNNKVNIPAGGVAEVFLSGYIAPGYKDGSVTTDLIPNYLFLDTTGVSVGAKLRLLYIAVYMEPCNGLSDSANIPLPMAHNAFITAEDILDYKARLDAARDSYGAFVPGSMGPVDQSTTGSGNLGFGLNAYYTTRTYHCFLPNSVYNSTAITRGSLWVPTKGKWTLGTDGNYRLYLDVAMYATSTTANIDVTYYYTGFLPSSTLGIALDTYPISLTQNVTKLNYKRITWVSATPRDGIAICPRVLRSGSNGNYWIFHNLFSVKVFPYNL